ncbi:MAG TPA: histidine kinase [Solirubrobacteraceae bacterium]|nr:histidine kinase [Solirubrobacteraceae bacterium]
MAKSSQRQRPGSPWSRDRSTAHEPFGRARVLGLMVWLLFIVVPVIDAITNTGSTREHIFAIAGALAFTAAYVMLVITWTDQQGYRRSLMLAGVMLVLACVLTIVDRPSWGFLFTYCAASLGLVVGSDLGMPAVVVCAAAAFGAVVAGGGSAGTGAGFAASAVGIGLLLVLLRDLRLRNLELCEARAELALSVVTAERERFARDLHDLLGHSLSVIAIKAELAGRLMKLDPERAAAEVADVEGVARESLREVREAVSGYRQPTLEKELEGARVALSAAGIAAEFERAPVALDPEVEAVLAWAVREGATNVIRHSGATHCQVRVRAGLGDAAVEVVDDGEGPACRREVGEGGEGGGVGEAGAVTGHGIIGLSERAERLRGRIEAGGLPDGTGFRLAVSIPTGGAPA